MQGKGSTGITAARKQVCCLRFKMVKICPQAICFLYLRKILIEDIEQQGKHMVLVSFLPKNSKNVDFNVRRENVEVVPLFQLIAFVNHPQFQNSPTPIFSQIHNSYSSSTTRLLSHAYLPSLLHYRPYFLLYENCSIMSFLDAAPYKISLSTKETSIHASSFINTSKRPKLPAISIILIALFNLQCESKPRQAMWHRSHSVKPPSFLNEEFRILQYNQIKRLYFSLSLSFQIIVRCVSFSPKQSKHIHPLIPEIFHNAIDPFALYFLKQNQKAQKVSNNALIHGESSGQECQGQAVAFRVNDSTNTGGVDINPKKISKKSWSYSSAFHFWPILIILVHYLTISIVKLSKPENISSLFIIIIQVEQKMSHLEFQIKSECLSAQEEPAVSPSLSSNIDASKKVKSRRAIRQNSQKYHWKKMENKRYVEFLTSMRWLFDLTTQEKRSIGINKMMSDYIRTRDSIQCHSHHQKIVKKYGSIDDAVREMAAEYCSKRRRQPRAATLMVKIQEVQEDGIRDRHIEEGLSNEKESTQLAATEGPAVKIEDEQHETVK